MQGGIMQFMIIVHAEMEDEKVQKFCSSESTFSMGEFGQLLAARWAGQPASSCFNPRIHILSLDHFCFSHACQALAHLRHIFSPFHLLTWPHFLPNVELVSDYSKLECSW